MRIRDFFRNEGKAQHERDTLLTLQRCMHKYIDGAEGYRNEFCATVVNDVLGLSTGNPAVVRSALLLCHALLAYEGHLHIPTVDTGGLTMAEAWKAKAAITTALQPFEKPEIAGLLREALTSLLRCLTADVPNRTETEDTAGTFAIPLSVFLRDLPQTLETIIRLPYRDDLISANLFEGLRVQFHRNLCLASGIAPDRQEKSTRALVLPTSSDLAGSELLNTYLNGTPFLDFFATPLPFSIPFRTRFEHTHIVGGSGHGKTQLLQHLILRDLGELKKGRGSIIVIDSQGDMLRTITQLAELSPTHPESLAERLVLIDPNDAEYPPALNLFDFGLERLTRYSPVDREKLINGAIALYEYVFGALLGAELTQRQGVIFRYLARLIMTIPGATIHTLMHFMGGLHLNNAGPI